MLKLPRLHARRSLTGPLRAWCGRAGGPRAGGRRRRGCENRSHRRSPATGHSGVDKNHPSDIVNVYAPISGVIVAQNVTNAVAAGVTYSGSSTAFTIADLSVVWIVCDVYGNDLPQMHLGQEAQIHFDSYPGQALTGKISDIGPVPDPSIRTAKVRIEVANPGMLRMGMFATATLIGRTRGG